MSTRVKQGVSVTLRGHDLVLLGDVLAAAAACRLGRTNDTATDVEILDLSDIYQEPYRAACRAVLQRVMDGYEGTGGYDADRADPPRTTGTVGTGTPPPEPAARWAVPPPDPDKTRIRRRFGITLLAAPNRASYRRLAKIAVALTEDASRAEAARNAALENAGVLAKRVIELEERLSLQTSVNASLLESPIPSSTRLHPEQQAHLVGISEYAMHGLVLFGTDDDGFARAIHNAFLLGQYWAELTLSPRWVELRVWKLHVQKPKTMHGGQEVFLHPSMLEGGYAHSGPPDYVNREGYDVDRWAGTRLAAHGVLWMMADGKPAIDGGAS